MTEVKHFITAKSDVISIVTLSEGNVYKRLSTPSYGADKVVFGIVDSLQNNGTEAYISVLEFDPSEYGGGTLKSTVFSSEKEVNIFPCTVEDWQAALASNRNALARQADKKHGEAEEADANLAALIAAAKRATDKLNMVEAETMEEAPTE